MSYQEHIEKGVGLNRIKKFQNVKSIFKNARAFHLLFLSLSQC